MPIFWMLTYIDDADEIRRKRYEDEDSARDAWYSTEGAIFLDQVYRYESKY